MINCEMRRCEGMNEVGYCLMYFWDDRFVVRWFQNFNVVSFFSEVGLSVMFIRDSKVVGPIST